MRRVPSMAVIALAISTCLPPAKAVELPRSAIGSEQARLTALMQGPSKDEAAASGFSVAAVTDEAYLVEAGDHRTCVVVLERTPPSMDVPIADWSFELDGAPEAPDDKDATLASYPYVGNGEPPFVDGGTAPRVAIHRALVCGPALLKGDNNEVSLLARFRTKDGIEWTERFMWDLR